MKKPQNTDPTNYPTLTAFASAVGIPLNIARQLKKAGAHGFETNGRVHPLRVLKWLATKGKNFQPALSLESARALLAESRARAIQQAVEMRGGAHVELGNALAAFDQSLENLGAFVDALQSDAWLLAEIANGGKKRYAEAEIRYQLAQMASSFWSNVDGSRASFEARLASDADAENLLARYQRILAGLGETFSAALQKIHDALPPEHRETVLAAWKQLSNPQAEAEAKLRELDAESRAALRQDLAERGEAVQTA